MSNEKLYRLFRLQATGGENNYRTETGVLKRMTDDSSRNESVSHIFVVITYS